MTVPDDKECVKLSLRFNINSIISVFVDVRPTQHPQSSSIQHWQLKDLLTFNPSNDNELLTVYHSHVAAYNIKTRTARKVLRELTFQPTCMTAAAGYVAVGGQRSQVVVKDIKTDWRAATCIGGAINNCVHVSAHVGITHPRLFVCNNDETTKIFQLPTMEHVATIRSTTAVNGVAVSPDGRYMVIVGDTNEVLLYSIRGGGFGDHYYERIALLTTNKDAGFSCSWDQTSTKFAVGCQDACVCVWDVRSVKKLAQIPSTQASGRGAVRSVKFTRYGSIDLLAFTEHTSFLNVVDSRTFDGKDSIRIGNNPTTDINITGLAFAPDSRNIYVGTEQAVLEYSVDTRKRRGFPSGQII